MIRDLRKYLSGLFEFDSFDKYLNYGCKFSDIDLFTERNGYMLNIETKSEGAALPPGQKKAIKQITKKSESICWLVVWGTGGYIEGKENKIDSFSIWYKGVCYGPIIGIELGLFITFWQNCANVSNFDKFIEYICDAISKKGYLKK